MIGDRFDSVLPARASQEVSEAGRLNSGCDRENLSAAARQLLTDF